MRGRRDWERSRRAAVRLDEHHLRSEAFWGHDGPRRRPDIRRRFTRKSIKQGEIRRRAVGDEVSIACADKIGFLAARRLHDPEVEIEVSTPVRAKRKEDCRRPQTSTAVDSTLWCIDMGRGRDLDIPSRVSRGCRRPGPRERVRKFWFRVRGYSETFLGAGLCRQPPGSRVGCFRRAASRHPWAIPVRASRARHPHACRTGPAHRLKCLQAAGASGQIGFKSFLRRAKSRCKITLLNQKNSLIRSVNYFSRKLNYFNTFTTRI